MADKVRVIVSCSLVYVDWEPLVLLEDKKKAEQLVTIAKEKGKDAFIKQLTLPEERKVELGNNIFNITKQLPRNHIENILKIRERLIREAFDVRDVNDVEVDIAWKKVAKKYGEPYTLMSWSDFNQWTLDVAQFVLIQR